MKARPRFLRGSPMLPLRFGPRASLAGRFRALWHLVTTTPSEPPTLPREVMRAALVSYALGGTGALVAFLRAEASRA